MSARVGLRRAVGGFVGESQVSNDFLKIVGHLMTGGGLVANRGWVEKLGSLFALCDYRPSLSRETFEGGDLHWGLRH